ncbi:MAG: hypothetical protein E2P05_02415 [Acidobacteria bacterium]|nr:MAG: hypothetical protein E2P05_02415 [Acidobacteriota bacterium]
MRSTEIMKAQRKRRFGQARGFSLVELLIVTAVMIVVLGLIGSLMITTQRQYMSQQALIDASNNARVGLDLMLRLARVAGNNPNPEDFSFEPIHPDPDGNSQMDSIRLLADWNPGDGDTDDAYEDMIFSTSNGVLWIQRPSDDEPVEFVDRVESLTFSYKDSDGADISSSDAVANRDSIAYVDIELRTSVPDVPAMLFKSSAVIRSRK